jgi:hypothetical protein
MAKRTSMITTFHVRGPTINSSAPSPFAYAALDAEAVERFVVPTVGTREELTSG